MDFLGGSLRLGTFAGITVRVHMLYVIWMLFRLFDSGGVWQWTLLYLGMLFVIILIHEFGHCFGARAVGGSAHDILMWPLGGLAFAEAPMTPWAQFVTVACGPLVNVVFCVISAAVLIVSAGELSIVSINPLRGAAISWASPGFYGPLAMFYDINLMLLAFNLLPVFPFDGGQLFRTLIWPFVGLARATLISAGLGLAGAAALGVWGLTGGGMMLVVLAVFAGMTSWQHFQAARGLAATEHYRSADAILLDKRRTRGWWSRWFGRRPHAVRTNPNPGGWEAKVQREEALESELDRILKKVHAEGIASLTYVERQTLERATRARQQS